MRVARVRKSLTSVYDACAAGHLVVFDFDNEKIGEQGDRREDLLQVAELCVGAWDHGHPENGNRGDPDQHAGAECRGVVPFRGAGSLAVSPLGSHGFQTRPPRTESERVRASRSAQVRQHRHTVERRLRRSSDSSVMAHTGGHSSAGSAVLCLAMSSSRAWSAAASVTSRRCCGHARATPTSRPRLVFVAEVRDCASCRRHAWMLATSQRRIHACPSLPRFITSSRAVVSCRIVVVVAQPFSDVT